MRIISKFISYIFHPIFMLFYILVALLVINPYLFNFQNPKDKGLLIITVFISSVFFPLISTLIMRGLGFVKSFEMTDRMERIGPFIATAIFYLWLFTNIKDNNQVPFAYTVIVLSSIIGLFIGFAVNTISKVSIHSIGVGGLLGAILLIKFNFSYQYFHLDLSSLGIYLVNINVVIILGLIIAGLVGTARLHLKVHKEQDVYGGYIIGLFSQIAAIFFMM